jgi:ribosomal protein S12 methylthiotransferase
VIFNYVCEIIPMSRKRKQGREETYDQPVAHLVSLGCAKNLVDSEIMLGALAQAGFAVSASPEGADVVLVNTCGFVRDAVDESEDVIRELAALRREGGCGRLVVAGCLAQRRQQALREKFPEIDLLIGTSAYTDIVELLNGDASESFPPRTAMPDHTFARLPSTPPWTAFLRTAEGCSNRCAYCIIPYIRGDFRSRTPDSLVREARDLAAMGVRELVLVAQDNTRFGLDLPAPSSLPALLESLSSIESIDWIRVMYCHPARVDENLLRAFANTPKVLPYLDMPIQHAHPDILRAMNRPENPAEVLRAIERARELMPDVCIRTTALVGFPGETERHFKALLDFVDKAQFDRLGAFRYSPEPEAPAAFMQAQVREDVKGERLDRLMNVQSEIALKRNQIWVGRELDVLIEGPSDSPGMSAGRSFRDAPDVDGYVFVKGEHAPGAFVRARVRTATHYDLVAEPVD